MTCLNIGTVTQLTWFGTVMYFQPLVSKRGELVYTYISNNTLQHKHGVSITLTCWFEEKNTNDAPPFVISVLDVDSIPYHFYTAKECETNPIKRHKSHYNTVKP